MSKATPGPWERGPGMLIQGEHHPIVFLAFDNPNGESDARRIIAAPEMEAALEGIVYSHGRTCTCLDCPSIRAALARAKGAE